MFSYFPENICLKMSLPETIWVPGSPLLGNLLVKMLPEGLDNNGRVFPEGLLIFLLLRRFTINLAVLYWRRASNLISPGMRIPEGYSET